MMSGGKDIPGGKGERKDGMGSIEIMKGKEMKKLMVLSLAVLSLLTLGVMVGCDNKTTTVNQQSGGKIASIELRSTHYLIRGYQGDIATETITAIGRDVANVALAGQKIDFAIISPVDWKGTIAKLATDSLSDENGQVEATYQVVIQQSGEVVIEAYSSTITSRITITIEVPNEILGPISVEAAEASLGVPPNVTRSTDVTARILDLDGEALPGMRVKFSVDPAGMGVMSSDTGTTDNNGAVTRKFTSIVNRYGTATIKASVGDSTGTTQIQVRPVSAPAKIVLSTPNPTVKVAPGQSAIIPLFVHVTDSNHVGVPGIHVDVAITSEGGATTFGAVTAFDTTDGNGLDSTTFTSLASFGRVKVTATVVPSSEEDPIFAELTLNVERLNNDIGSLTLRAFPNFIITNADTLGESLLRAQVRDADNIAIPNVQVNFVTDFGSLSNITVTDSFGVATAKFGNNYEAGTAHILASIPGTGYEATTSIVVQLKSEVGGTLQISSDVGEIFADNGLTVARITALLKDGDNQALSGRELIFTSTHGAITSPIMTDALGRVDTIFTDVGLASLDQNGNVIPARIYVRYDPLGLKDSCEVTISPRNPVAEISLTTNKNQMIAASGDTASIKATAVLANGRFASIGTLVQFEVAGNNGQFVPAAVPVGSFGVAETKYIAGNFVGDAILRAYVENEGDTTVYSNEVVIHLLPGPPNNVRVTANPTELFTNDPNTFSTITAIVTDTAGNAVEAGTLVRFATTMGDITPSAITNDNGIAYGRLTPGVSAGVAEVTATVNLVGGTQVVGNATVTFTAGNPNVIQISANPLQIAVKETGGIETTTLTATVLDPNGNNIGRSTTVVFTLLNQPPPDQGCAFSNGTQIDSARTANGTAVMSLNAGFQIGGVLIKAYTWRDPDTVWVDDEHTIPGLWRRDTVSVILSTVQVVAGPPAAIDIDVNDDGDDAGGGTWQIPVSARVFDNHLNPVANNIPVGFTVIPDDIATIDPGYTGNDIGSGATPGLAFAWLYYHSVKTFEQITIQAEVQVADGQIVAQREHLLPLQDGTLELNVDPQNWMFDRQRPDDTCLVRCWVVLQDGHQITINNGPILFRTDRARFFWRNQVGGRYTMFFPEVARKYTGVQNQNHNEPPGVATVYLRGKMADFYLDDFTLEVTVHVEASVEGYDVTADPGFLFCTRH